MACTCLLIHDSSFGNDSLLDFLPMDDCYSWERTTWDYFTPQSLQGREKSLLVAIALTECEAPLTLFRWLRGHPLRNPTLAVIPFDSGAELLGHATETADDFILWPTHSVELRCRIRRILGPAVSVESIRHKLSGEIGLSQLIGNESVFLAMMERIPLAAASDAPVLLSGETGTGKELCARAIHHLSPRHDFPFVPVECGAVPQHLVENELFGHARGAYTDAHGDQKGLVALAEAGTLFLDEIDALAPEAQAKLLRFLQEGTYRPLGSEKYKRANVRVIAASNCELETRIREGRFRSDLYFRLNVLRLQLPALRQRRGDISPLARHFLEKLTPVGKQRKAFSPAAMRLLESHDWPGNVRELYNIVQRAVVYCPGRQILPDHLPIDSVIAACPVTATAYNTRSDFRQAKAQIIESFERCYLKEVLRRNDGNITRSAREEIGR